MVAVALFARVWFGEPTADNRVHAFSDRPHAKTHNPRTAWEKSNGTRLSWRLPVKKRRSRQNRRTALGKIDWEPVYHGDHAFFRWRSRQNRRPTWEKSMRKPFTMAILQGKAGIAPKPATRRRLGKIRAEPVYHGDRETIRIGEAIRIGETRRDAPCRRNDRRQQAPISWFAFSRSPRGDECLKRSFLGQTRKSSVPG